MSVVRLCDELQTKLACRPHSTVKTLAVFRVFGWLRDELAALKRSYPVERLQLVAFVRFVGRGVGAVRKNFYVLARLKRMTGHHKNPAMHGTR
ncbi:hypothetical protein J9M50_004424 [Salmonella enterica]|nr:hypothetical protein [Salmonella enterica]EHI9910807.1 hypothetical protein [Salmonella enterica]EHJ0911013.1 hypothetical protein [Salmonella enterica]